MLILCTGPDTFLAQRHAKKLEDAFREKHDASGTSIERLSFGKTAIKELESKAQTMSLFEPKRFFRTRNLLKEMAKKDLPSLSRVLSKNTDDVIVVSLEEDLPKADVLKQLEKEIKIIKYLFPKRTGHTFLNWVTSEAERIGVENASLTRELAERYEGDSWRVWNELMKLSAGGDISLKDGHEENIFDLIDGVLFRREGRHDLLLDEDKTKEVTALLPSQMRSAIRVRDGYSQGIHPFVQKKLAKANLSQADSVFAVSQLIFLFSRFGYLRDEESGVLLP